MTKFLNTHKSASIVLGCCLLPVLLGCGGGQLKTIDATTLELNSATPEELVSHINGDAGRIAGLKGKLTMGIQRNPEDSVERCRGVIISEKGSSDGRGLYLKGYRRLLPTFFTLVSNGREFWLHIPRKDVVYTGPVEFTWDPGEEAAFYLKPVDLFRALFVRPVEMSAVVNVQNEDSMYVVSVHADGGTIGRVLWVERGRFSVVREVYYDSTGSEALEIHRARMADIDGSIYPSHFALHDRIGKSTVYLDFSSITINPEDVDTSAFRFDIPQGVETRRIDEGVPQT